MLLIALPLYAFAVEADDQLLVDHDVRVTLSALPRSYEATLTNKTTGFGSSATGSADGGWLAIDYQASLHHQGPVSFLIGGGLDFLGTSITDDTTKGDVSGVGPRFAIGASFRPTSIFSIEGTLDAGFGAASSTIKDSSSNLDLSSDSGSYGMFAALVRGVFTFKPGFQAFGQLGYAVVKYNTTYAATATTDSADQSLRVSGGTFGLGVGWRF